MKTAIDSSVLIDVVGRDPRFGEKSLAALRAAYDAGALVACEVVWAEVRAHYPSDDELTKALAEAGISFEPLSLQAALLAGKLWRQARKDRIHGKRVVADFLIGAHAMLHSDALLTRDRGFYRSYFSGLKLIDPS
jgi:predicted nucleic acid-binding protein